MLNPLFPRVSAPVRVLCFWPLKFQRTTFFSPKTTFPLFDHVIFLSRSWGSFRSFYCAARDPSPSRSFKKNFRPKYFHTLEIFFPQAWRNFRFFSCVAPLEKNELQFKKISASLKPENWCNFLFFYITKTLQILCVRHAAFSFNESSFFCIMRPNCVIFGQK